MRTARALIRIIPPLLIGCGEAPRAAAPVHPTASPAAPSASAPVPLSGVEPRGRIARREELYPTTSPDAGPPDGGVDASVPQGRIEPNAIKQVIRSAFPRFRKCYEAVLKTTPTARGRVSSRFIIGLDGMVEKVYSEAQDPSLPSSMVDCVSRVYLETSFPLPGNGKVMVTYPIDYDNKE